MAPRWYCHWNRWFLRKSGCDGTLSFFFAPHGLLAALTSTIFFVAFFCSYNKCVAHVIGLHECSWKDHSNTLSWNVYAKLVLGWVSNPTYHHIHPIAYGDTSGLVVTKNHGMIQHLNQRLVPLVWIYIYRWWQLKYLYSFTPILGEIRSNFTTWYFSNGLLQPPTRNSSYNPSYPFIFGQ